VQYPPAAGPAEVIGSWHRQPAHLQELGGLFGAAAPPVEPEVAATPRGQAGAGVAGAVRVGEHHRE
jgi:hypothetical protein